MIGGNKEMEAHMLTTIDNPYNPFTHYNEWMAWDIRMGYNTNGMLARLAKTSDALSDSENEEEAERAMNRIIELDPLGLFIKISAKQALEQEKNRKTGKKAAKSNVNELENVKSQSQIGGGGS
jgi:hypothetical protein